MCAHIQHSIRPTSGCLATTDHLSSLLHRFILSLSRLSSELTSSYFPWAKFLKTSWRDEKKDKRRLTTACPLSSTLALLGSHPRHGPSSALRGAWTPLLSSPGKSNLPSQQCPPFISRQTMWGKLRDSPLLFPHLSLPWSMPEALALWPALSQEPGRAYSIWGNSYKPIHLPF